MKPIFTLEYFVAFLQRPGVSSDALKDEDEEKEEIFEKENQKWTENVVTLYGVEEGLPMQVIF